MARGGKESTRIKHELFALEYLKDLNAAQAAIRAGYAKDRARITACRLLKLPDVLKIIHSAAAKRSKKCEVDAEYVLRKSKEMLEKCMQDIPVLDSNGDPTGEYRFDSAGAGKALKLLGDHVAINAFKGVGDDGQPIDQNWTVKIVSVTQKEYEKGKNGKKP